MVKCLVNLQYLCSPEDTPQCIKWRVIFAAEFVVAAVVNV